MRERMRRSRMCSCQSMPVLNRLQESGEAGLLRAAGAADRRAALRVRACTTCAGTGTDVGTGFRAGVNAVSRSLFCRQICFESRTRWPTFSLSFWSDPAGYPLPGSRGHTARSRSDCRRSRFLVLCGV